MLNVMQYLSLRLFYLLSFCVLFLSQLSAEVVFRDDFGSTPFSWDLNSNLAERQGGRLAPLQMSDSTANSEPDRQLPDAARTAIGSNQKKAHTGLRLTVGKVPNKANPLPETDLVWASYDFDFSKIQRPGETLRFQFAVGHVQPSKASAMIFRIGASEESRKSASGDYMLVMAH